jgi:UDP-N-acetylglucosamine 2-epimerase (non-hydrolysing)
VTILHVVGARPNFMKLAPVFGALRDRGAEQLVVHTGQHYDAAMSEIFFEHLGLPAPDVNLSVGSGTQSVQTAEVMMRFEPVVLERKPRWVVVYGDVNSTVAAALVCAKLRVKVAHVEAGLRSRDRSMPEEINRLVTDQLADLLLTPSPDGDENLRNEGIPAERIRFVGNVMIDTLIRLLPVARLRWPQWREKLGLERFGLLTLHRPSNVDDPAKLARILGAIVELSRDLPIVFPVHPRTRESLRTLQIDVPPTLRLVDPLGYLDFLSLQERSTLVITDSGGVQEETTYLRVPCLTLRANTERPVTITVGTNVLIGDDLDLLRAEVARVLRGEKRHTSLPDLWDGRAGERIADILLA